MARKKSAAAASDPGAADPVAAVIIECPLAAPTGYSSADLGQLSQRYARIMGRLTAGLQTDDQRTAAGKPITTPRESLCWLLDKIEAAAESAGAD